MSEYYTAQRRSGMYNPASKEPFKLSRSKIDLFLECPRCFYTDNKLGVARPPGFPFSLNSAVDKLLKKEFDSHRAKGSAHPFMKKYGIDAVPLQHTKIEEWRDSLRAGIAFRHAPTGFLVRGGVDDVWVRPNGELIVVETNPKFLRVLKDIEDSRLKIIKGTAQEISKELKRHNHAVVDLVISSIPFSILKPAIREDIVNNTFDMLRSSGKFIIFQYSPLMLSLLKKYFDANNVSTQFELRNIPPMFIMSAQKLDLTK